MNHQGKLLKKAVERLGLTQKVAAKKMGYATHQAFAALYQKEEFNEMQIQKLVNALGIERQTFFPQSTVAEPAQNYGPSCWQQLAEARQEIIDLQKQIINMTMPNINSPKVKQTV